MRKDRIKIIKPRSNFIAILDNLAIGLFLALIIWVFAVVWLN